MCELTLSHLHDEKLNKMMFLLLGTLGSTGHKDGWGFSTGEDWWKCSRTMLYDLNSGEQIRSLSAKNDIPLIGHIRNASPMVPVTKENAHPFVQKKVTFMHNGKLTPFEEKNFDIEYTVTTKDKEGKEKTEVFKRSDSEIFFKEFLRDLGKDKDVVKALNTTMSKFYGKFAFILSVDGVYYVVKGKTANLARCYLLDSNDRDANILGYVVNTNLSMLDTCTTLLNNIVTLSGGNPLYFTYPEELKTETIYKVEANAMVEIGEIKENATPAKSYYGGEWEGRGNFSGKGAGTNHSTNITTGIGETKTEEKIRKLFEFMSSYSVNIGEISYLFRKIYNISLLEMTEELLTEFVDDYLPLFLNYTNKEIRKRIRKTTYGYSVGFSAYNDEKLELEFPWMISPKQTQVKLCERLEKK